MAKRKDAWQLGQTASEVYMTSNKKDNKVYGYVMLPCFKIVITQGECFMICGKALRNIFELFFAPFWNGAVHIYE